MTHRQLCWPCLLTAIGILLPLQTHTLCDDAGLSCHCDVVCAVQGTVPTCCGTIHTQGTCNPHRCYTVTHSLTQCIPPTPVHPHTLTHHCPTLPHPHPPTPSHTFQSLATNLAISSSSSSSRGRPGEGGCDGGGVVLCSELAEVCEEVMARYTYSNLATQPCR